MELGLDYASFANPRWKSDSQGAGMALQQILHTAQKFCQLLLEWNWDFTLNIAQINLKMKPRAPLLKTINT